MPGFRDYLNSNNPAAAMSGAMASQGGGGEYGAMVAQLVQSMGSQRAAQQANRNAAQPGGVMPGGPGMPGDSAAPPPRGGMPQGAPMGGGPQMQPGAMQAFMGGGAPQGGGMSEYEMGRMIGQMLRQSGGAPR